MERCLPVGRVGENGSSIGVLDHKKKTEKHKRRITNKEHDYRLKLKKKKK